MKRILLVISTFILVLLACTPSKSPEPTVTPTLPPLESDLDPTKQPGLIEPQPQSEKRCGDAVCDWPETAQTCPDDCGFGDTSQSTSTWQEFWVTNPTSGNQLYVHITTPTVGKGPYPVLVLVPGGVGDSNDMLSNGIPPRLADSGFVVVVFDPDGRSQSEGVEDYNGHIQQDGLAAVIRFTADHPDVDAAQFGLFSFSYGVTMAAGALARHPDLPVIFFIDWEGPVDRYDTTVRCSNSIRIDFSSCADDSFWTVRDALTFISDVRVPYLRLQSEVDHV
jgi:dienelactone hydrolase